MTFPAPTPDYEEPKSLQQLTDLSMISVEGALADAFQRIRDLEAAMLPFAVQGTMMANASMCLKGDGRMDEPAGGVWVSTLSNINMQPCEQLFYNAVDAMGRKRTEDHMVAQFEAMQAARAGAKERDAAVEGGAKAH